MTDARGAEQMMRASFEATLPGRLARAARVELQLVIPSHRFSAAASECIKMYLDGTFYGCISLAQAYVEALSKFLAGVNFVRLKEKPIDQWKELCAEKIVSPTLRDAAVKVLSGRNAFHHLTEAVEQDHLKLEEMAEACVNCLHTIESEVFAYSLSNGAIAPSKPAYWTSVGDDMVSVYLRRKD